MRYQDGDWSLMKWDAKTNVSTWGKRDENGNLVVRTDTPIEATLSENAAVRNIAEKAWRGDWHRVASIPLPIFYNQLQEAQSHGDQRYLSKWLNDADNRGFRTKEGHV